LSLQRDWKLSLSSFLTSNLSIVDLIFGNLELFPNSPGDALKFANFNDIVIRFCYQLTNYLKKLQKNVTGAQCPKTPQLWTVSANIIRKAQEY